MRQVTSCQISFPHLRPFQKLWLLTPGQSPQANQPQSSSNQPNLETRWHQKSKADSTLRCLSPDVGEVPKSKCRWIQELGRQRNSGFKKMARLQWVLAL